MQHAAAVGARGSTAKCDEAGLDAWYDIGAYLVYSSASFLYSAGMRQRIVPAL